MRNRRLYRHHSSPAAIYAVDHSTPDWNDHRQEFIRPSYIYSTISSTHHVVPLYRTYSPPYSLASMYHPSLFPDSFVGAYSPCKMVFLKPSIEFVRENACVDQLHDGYYEFGELCPFEYGIRESVPQLSYIFNFLDPNTSYSDNRRFRNDLNVTESNLGAHAERTPMPTSSLHQSVVNAVLDGSNEDCPAANFELSHLQAQNDLEDAVPGPPSRSRVRTLDASPAPIYRLYMKNNHRYHSRYLPRFLPFYTIFPGAKPYRMMPLKVPMVEGLENSSVAEPHLPREPTTEASDDGNVETRSSGEPSEQGLNLNDACENEDVVEFRKSCLEDPIVETPITKSQSNRFGCIGEKRM